MSEQRMQIDRLSWYGLILSATFPKAVGITQAIMARETGRGIWVATPLAVLLAALLVAVTAAAMGRLRTSLTPGVKRVIGSWCAYPAALVEALFYMLVYVGGVYTFIGHGQYFFLPEMPLLIFVIALGAIAIVASSYGFETIVRGAVIGAVGCVLLTAVTLPGIVWDLNLLNLFPINGLGWSGFARATGIGLADFLVPIGLTVSFLPSVQPRSGLVKHTALAVLAAGLLIGVWPLSEILVLGPSLTAQQAVACMTLARSAAIGMYIHRYELVMMFFFLPSVFLVGGLPFYGAAGALARIFHLKNRKPVFLPLFVVLSGSSLWLLGDRLQANAFFTNIWPPAIILLTLLLLAFAVLTAMLSPRPVDKPGQDP